MLLFAKSSNPTYKGLIYLDFFFFVHNDSKSFGDINVINILLKAIERDETGMKEIIVESS